MGLFRKNVPYVCGSSRGSLFRGPVGQWIILRVVIFTLLCGAGIGTLQMTAQSTVPFRLKEKPGSFGVGLKVVEQYDYSRAFQPLVDALGQPFQGERARPLQTLVWYPAQASSAKPMIYSDYIALKATETSFGRPKKLIGMEERHIGGYEALVYDRDVGSSRCTACARTIPGNHLCPQLLFGLLGECRFV